MSAKLYKNQHINQCIDNYNFVKESNQYIATKASNINDNMKQIIQN